MEAQNNDDMESLFDGMVLFTPQAVENHDGTSLSSVVHSSRDADTVALSSISSQSSQPLDENLFSDLTVISPIHVEPLETPVQTNPSSILTTTQKIEREEPLAAPMSRQSSRKKKRGGVRIGYGRDSQLIDDPEPLPNSRNLPSPSQSSFSSAIPSIHSDVVAEGKEIQQTLPSRASLSTKNGSSPLPSQNEFVDGDSKYIVESRSQQVNEDRDLTLTENKNVASPTLEVEDVCTPEKQENEEEETSNSVEVEYELIKAQISEKLKQSRQKAASISAAKKKSTKRRRQAAENTQLASLRYAEIEKKLEEACEAEDFEMAERLSESLAASEKERESLLNALREAEAECDDIDSKMQEVLELQIAAEEECVSLLQRFSMVAGSSADSVLENVEVNFSHQMDEWYSVVEAMEGKKLELEIESLLVNEARSTLHDSIGHLAHGDVKEKEVLCERKKLLTEELEKLLKLVKEKEAEIAENDAQIEVIDERINKVASGFMHVEKGIDAMSDKLQFFLSQMETEHEDLQKKKDEIDKLLSEGTKKGEELRKLVTTSSNEIKVFQDNLGLRKKLVTSVLKVREEKTSLAKTEEEILADIQMLKQEVSISRASLQELSSKKSSIQQDNATLKQRVVFIDKRVPELEAEKKVAATARNFKEAARIASEAKSLTSEKEDQQIKMEEFTLELGKIDEEINQTTNKLEEFEILISSKEKEAALARVQRLCLISSISFAERWAALELGDIEEAEILLAEAKATDSEAKQLQTVHNISDEEFETLSTNSSKHFIPMELVSSLDGKPLEDFAAGCDQSQL